MPVRGKFVDQLTGRYDVPGARERAVPDFYATYGQRHRKPVAVTETAALYAPDNGGASARAIKTRWWRQVFAPDLLRRRSAPRLGRHRLRLAHVPLALGTALSEAIPRDPRRSDGRLRMNGYGGPFR